MLLFNVKPLKSIHCKQQPCSFTRNNSLITPERRGILPGETASVSSTMISLFSTTNLSDRLVDEEENSAQLLTFTHTREERCCKAKCDTIVIKCHKY